jgi:hypothetical protein
MEPTRRMAADGAWDHLPEEIASLIAETSEAPLEDLRSLRLCNKAMKRASSSRAITNRFNLKHHYQSMVWEDADALNTYLQTIDWLQGANNGGALFVKGMDDICTGWPGGAALLERAEEEADLQASYVLAVLKYYKHGATDDVFNHFRHIYGEVTFGSQVGIRWWMEDEDYDEEDAWVMGVRHRVSEEICCVMWMEHINHYHVHEIHMPEDGDQCLWKWGCGKWSAPVFCSLRFRIRAELYKFLFRFPQIIDIMDDIDVPMNRLLHHMRHAHAKL